MQIEELRMSFLSEIAFDDSYVTTYRSSNIRPVASVRCTVKRDENGFAKGRAKYDFYVGNRKVTRKRFLEMLTNNEFQKV